LLAGSVVYGTIVMGIQNKKGLTRK